MSARPSRAGFAGLTDTGRARPHNEDSFAAEPPLYVVADGLGGHMAGEVASSLAVDEVRSRAARSADPAALARAVVAANHEVIEAARDGRGRAGMGTTLTAAVVWGTRITLAHAGDSRAYLLRAEGMEQLSRDHSVVGEMVRRGTLTPEEARSHPQRAVITRALGSDPDMQPDVYETEARPGDRLLLCTDGLTGMLTDAEIEEILRSTPDPDEAVRSLVDAANRAGGLDNVTAVVVGISEEVRAAAAPGRRIAARVLWLVAALAVVVTGALGAYAYAQSSAYVIAEDGVVVVYRGVPGSFAGVSLHWREQVTEVAVADLPPMTAGRLRDGIRVDDMAAAMDLVAEYRELADDAGPFSGLDGPADRRPPSA